MTRREGRPLPLGADVRKDGVNFAVEAPRGKTCELLLYRRGEKEPAACFDMPACRETGDVRFLALADLPAQEYEYNYRIDTRSRVEAVRDQAV